MPQQSRHDTPAPFDAHRTEETEHGVGMSLPAAEDRVITEAIQDEVEAEIDLADDRRVTKAEAQSGQGPKTRSRNKQIVSGKPYD